MSKRIIILIVVLVLAFFAYRYFVWGKGNKGLINPTLFGF